MDSALSPLTQSLSHKLCLLFFLRVESTLDTLHGGEWFAVVAPFQNGANPRVHCCGVNVLKVK